MSKLHLRVGSLLFLVYCSVAIVFLGTLHANKHLMIGAYLISAFFWYASAVIHFFVEDRFSRPAATFGAIAALAAAVGTTASIDHAWSYF